MEDAGELDREIVQSESVMRPRVAREDPTPSPWNRASVETNASCSAAPIMLETTVNPSFLTSLFIGKCLKHLTIDHPAKQST